jgi:hypothetical protein
MGWKAIGAKLLNFSKSVSMHWEEAPKDNTNQIELFD